ncbi:MAG: hypothetical protein AAGK22_21455, partial [Acidobacteriota bacterium]
GVSAPVWSADGAIRRVMEDELGVGTGDPLVAAWGADGDKVMIEQDGRGLGLFDGVSSPEWLDVLPDASRADISPDGHWIAYRSRASGQSDVYVQRLDGGEAYPIASGFTPKWSLDGRRLYYNTRCEFFVVEVGAGEELDFGLPRPLVNHCDLVDLRTSRFEVDREGRFYVMDLVPDSGVITSLDLVQHWADTIEH